MRNRTVSSSALDRILGSFGMVLVVLLGWACKQMEGEPHTLATRTRWVSGWLVLESITAIGWTLDLIAPVAVTDDTRGFAGVHPSGLREPQR